MKVKFLSNIDYQTFPITDDMIEVEDDLIKQIGINKQFVNNQIVDYHSNEEEIQNLKEKLATFDYIGVKIATGVATKEEYAEKIAYCESLREKIRKLGG